MEGREGGRERGREERGRDGGGERRGGGGGGGGGCTLEGYGYTNESKRYNVMP